MTNISRRHALKTLVSFPVLGLATPVLAQQIDSSRLVGDDTHTPEYVEMAEYISGGDWNKVSKVVFGRNPAFTTNFTPVNVITGFHEGEQVSFSCQGFDDQEVQQAFWYILNRVKSNTAFVLDRPLWQKRKRGPFPKPITLLARSKQFRA